MNRKYLVYTCAITTCLVLVGVAAIVNFTSPGQLSNVSASNLQDELTNNARIDESLVPSNIQLTEHIQPDLQNDSTIIGIGASNDTIESYTTALSIDSIRDLIAEGKIDDAVQALSNLYSESESYSNKDRIISADLYADLLIKLEVNQEAFSVIEDLLKIENLSQEQRLKSLNSLGQLFLAEIEYEEALSYFERYFQAATVIDPEALLGFSLSNYHLDNYDEAIPPMVDYVSLMENGVQAMDEGRLLYLNALALRTQDWANVQWVSQILIDQFNNPRDWKSLGAAYAEQGDEDGRLQVIADARAAGVIDASGNWVPDL